jgi:thiamine-phosphate pyrophosphorylase
MMTRRPSLPAGRIYAIADVDALGATPLPSAVRRMAEAGISWIQIRAKKAAGEGLFRSAEAAVSSASVAGAALWLDDRADLAALLPFAGVHLGQRDLPPAAARRVVGEAMWIGQSTHREDQLERAAGDPDVDVVAVGPIFPTTGKENPDPTVGLSFLRWARSRTDKPLVAIGGIDAGNLSSVLGEGADAAAVLGAVCRGDVGESCSRLLAAAAYASIAG